MVKISRSESISNDLATTDCVIDGGSDSDRELSELQPFSTTGKVLEGMSLFREICFVGIIAISQLLTQACLAQALAPLHYIGASFNITKPGDLSWFCASYSLTVGTFILPAGRLGDLFGSRKLFQIGYVWFAIWTLIAGFSVYCNAILFHFCRALQGLGPALILPNGLALLGRAYKPGMRRNMAFAVFGAVAPFGFLMGATFAGIFAQFVWWPWNFWVGAIIMAFATLISTYCIPLELDKSELSSFHRSDIAKLDPVGIATGVTGLVLFNIAWNQGSNVGWSVPYTSVLLVLGVLLFTLFIVNELKWAEYPLLPIRELPKEIYFVLASIGLGWSSFGIWIYYWWQISLQLRQNSILLTVAMQSPASITGAIAAISVGYLLSRFGANYIILVSMIAFCVGCILMGTMPIHQTYWAQTFVGVCIIAFGMDMSFPSGTIILSDAMTKEHQGIAGSLINTIVNYSVSIGLGIAGTVESQINKDRVHLKEGYRSALYVGIGLSGLGIVCALLHIISAKIDRKPGIDAVEKPDLENGCNE
ncbi:uncharacterized protein V2V93DRAFT_361202 [Kockiozyma suomiensis]|uniref:uncharacterized protein n=1 Tax=Kockiozyma suomiensis TaxID=1337062 RepID=UPI003344180D